MNLRQAIERNSATNPTALAARSDHPMLAEYRPLIPTRPMERFSDSLNLALETGAGGILSHGDGRVGKTKAAAMLARLTHWRPWPMAFYWWNYSSPKVPSEGYFFTSMLNASNQKSAKNCFATDILARARNHLLREAAKESAKIIALVVDESNRFVLDDFTHLVSLDNDLELLGKRLFAILLSQNDADPNGPQSILRQMPSHIAGRFLNIKHHYTGLLWEKPDTERHDEFENDVWLAFNEYDVGVCHGPETTPCTQWFAPNAYALGFRLTNQIELYRKEIEDLRSQNGLPPGAPWPMKTFEAFVYYLLVRIAGEDPGFREFTPEQVRRALQFSGYIALELSRFPNRPK